MGGSNSRELQVGKKLYTNGAFDSPEDQFWTYNDTMILSCVANKDKNFIKCFRTYLSNRISLPDFDLNLIFLPGGKTFHVYVTLSDGILSMQGHENVNKIVLMNP